jgi:pyruvate formate lyase activating enzyme
MKLFGLIKESFQEYEGEVSLVFFSKGCDFKCPRCYNLQQMQKMDVGDARTLLDRELTDLHTAVVFLGGEPTLWPDLIPLTNYVHEKGLKTKVYTNGYNPTVIYRLVEKGHVDSISVDFKAIRDYETILGVPAIEYKERLTETISYLVAEGIEMEIRTTIWDREQLDDIINYIEDNFPKVKHILQEDKFFE